MRPAEHRGGGGTSRVGPYAATLAALLALGAGLPSGSNPRFGVAPPRSSGPGGRLLGIAARPARVQPGQAFILQVTLNRPAGHGGAVIHLKCSEPSLVRLPRRLRIPSGERSVDLSVTVTRDRGTESDTAERRIALKAWDEITQRRLAAGHRASTVASPGPVYAPVRRAVLIVEPPRGG